MKILYLYCPHSTHVMAVYDHLHALLTKSKYEVSIEPATPQTFSLISFDDFDVVAIHYSLRVNLEGYVSRKALALLEKFSGLKVLFIQDEYDSTYKSHDFIAKYNIKIVFTCVPAENVDLVYPKHLFPDVNFVTVFTGYVSENMLKAHMNFNPIDKREYWVVYRGRKLHPVYGKLGYEKYIIGEKVKEYCLENGIPIDIETEDKFRIYGKAWPDFISSGRATLATESGSNIFDLDGNLRTVIDNWLKKNKSFSFEELEKLFCLEHEGRFGQMNQLSPKMFEAVASKTLLIMFEGHYSGVFLPWVHFWPLKKDFTNLPILMDKLGCIKTVSDFVNSAYEDLILSGRYSYDKFVCLVDHVYSEAVLKKHSSITEANKMNDVKYNKHIKIMPRRESLSQKLKRRLFNAFKFFR